MIDTLISVKLLNSGSVEIVRDKDGSKWRRAVSPHSEAELDQYAPELPSQDRSVILAKWATVPVPTPDPPAPTPTLAELSALSGSQLNTPVNRLLFAALWEMHQAITGAVPLPAETKNQYKQRLLDLLVTFLPGYVP